MTHPFHACPCCGGAFDGLMKAARAAGERRERGLPATGGVSRRGFLAGTALAGGLMAAPVRLVAEEAPVRLFHGGTILTVDAAFSQAEALAIRGNTILAVGDLAAVRAAAGPGAEEIDLAGRVMLPGFVEPHAHVLSGAAVDSMMANVGAAYFPTAADVLVHLAERVAATPAGDWVMARNYDPALQAGPDALTFAELDAVSADVPVFVMNSSGHLAYANRAAFRAAGIPDDVANPPGAEFVRDGAGALTGVMKNNVAFLQVAGAAPQMGRLDPVGALIGLLDGWGKLGLTTVSELSLGALTQSPEDAALLFAAGASGKLKARVRAYPFYTLGTATWDAAGIAPGQGDALVRIAGWKLVADGSNQGFTGLQREPYLGSENRGVAYMTPEDMAAQAVERAGKGWPLAIHGNGDAGIDTILDALAAVKASGADMGKVRARIEHCSMLHDEQIARMQDLGVAASMLIGHVYFWGVWMRDQVFGPERVMHLCRAASVKEAGLSLSLHSDFMVTDPDPLQMIQMAVTRQTWAEPGFVLNPAERISVEQAIRAVTWDAAWQLGSDHEVGSLEAGKLADLVILETDPRQVPVEAIKDIRVLETWMDGRQVWAA